jgi:CHAT domain-containing protein
MRVILKVFITVSLFICLTNYSHSKINEYKIILKSYDCLDEKKKNIEISFLEEAQKLITDYKKNEEFSKLLNLLRKITFCYESLDEKNKTFFQQKYFEDVEFLIKNESYFKNAENYLDYLSLLNNYLINLASNKDFKKKNYDLIEIVEKLQKYPHEFLFGYNYALISYDIDKIKDSNFLNFFRILEVTASQLNYEKDQDFYFGLINKQSKLLKTFKIEDCKNFFDKTKKNVQPNGYSAFINNARTISECYLSTNKKDQSPYNQQILFDHELYIKNQIELFIENEENFIEDEKSGIRYSKNYFKKKLRAQHLISLHNLYSYAKIFNNKDYIKKDYLEKYNQLNYKYFFNDNKSQFLIYNKLYVNSLIDENKIEKAQEEIENSLVVIKLNPKDFLKDSVWLDLSKNDETSEYYEEGLIDANLELENLKFDFLISKSRILKLLGNYKENIEIVEKKLTFLIDNYSSDLNSFESINEITDNYREIVDSYIILNDYPKAQTYLVKADKHCKKLEKNIPITASRDDHKFNYLSCRELYKTGFNLILKIGEKEKIKEYYLEKIEPLLNYFDLFDEQDKFLDVRLKNQRLFSRDIIRIKYYLSQGITKSPGLCNLIFRINKTLEEDPELYPSRDFLGMFLLTTVCINIADSKNNFDIKKFEKLINISVKDYIDNVKYISGFSDFSKKSQETDPVISLSALIYASIYEFSKDQNEKDYIKGLLGNIFTNLQYQDSEYLINSTKSLNNKFKENDNNFALLVKEKNQLSKKIEVINSRLFDVKTNNEIQILIDKKKEIKDQIELINLKVKKNYPKIDKMNRINVHSISEIQNKLKNNEALIYFDTKFDESILSYVILKNDFMFFNNYEYHKTLEKVEDLRNGIVNKDENFLVWSDLIYKKLFKNQTNYLNEKKIDKIFIIIDKKLSNLPFEILVINGPEFNETTNVEKYLSEIKNLKLEYLINKFSISYFPSVSTFFENYDVSEPISSNTAFFGIGSPSFIKKEVERNVSKYLQLNSRGYLENTSVISERYNEIPGTKKELNNLKLLFHKNKILLDNLATETNLKNEDLSQYGIISFATHAEVSDKLEGFNEPFLVLTPPKLPSAKDDGLLTTSEIFALNLNARLVILSACDTAAKNNKYADGFSGLVNSFLIAGADSVIASHWRVDDYSTNLLINEILKKAVQGNLNISESMREIKLNFINGSFGEEYKKPLYWAPFILIGK